MRTAERLAAWVAISLLAGGIGLSVAMRAQRPGLLLAADVAYGPDHLERADIYGARGLSRAPVAIFFHGGAYAFGDKNEVGGVWGNVARALARAGCLALNADYRLSPRSPWPAGAEDVGRLVRWARAHAAAFGGDPRRIVLIGHSAGATHVAGYVLDPRLEPDGDPGVAGAVLVSGRYTLGPIPGDPNGPEVRAYFGGDTVRGDRAPIAHLATAHHLPLLVVVAGRENTGLARGASSLVAALCALGACQMFERLAGETHLSEMANVGTDDQALSAPLIRFVRSVPAR